MDYSDDKLLNKLEEIEKEKEDIENYKKYIEVWKKYLKIDENINLLLPDDLLILSKFDFRDPKDIPHPPYKYPRINFLVFDDLVGSANAFKKGHSAINNLTINQPINLSDINSILIQIKGVQAVIKLEIINKQGGNYSPYAYDISGATRQDNIYPSIDPSVFEVRYPDTDIQGRVVI